jgi:hypothetical protein
MRHVANLKNLLFNKINVLIMKKVLFSVLFLTAFSSGLFYACKESSLNPSVVTVKELIADSDFKNFAVLWSESKKGLFFLNPANTKESKLKQMEEFKRLSLNSENPQNKLLLVQMLGYSTVDEFQNKYQLLREALLKVCEKYPVLKQNNDEGREMHKIVISAFYAMHKELPYIMLPNRHGIASVYSTNDILRLKTLS